LVYGDAGLEGGGILSSDGSRCYATGAWESAYLNHSFAADVEAYVQVPVLPTADAYLSLMARVQNVGSATAAAWYYLTVHYNGVSTWTWEISHYDHSTSTDLVLVSSTQTLSAGDWMGLQIVGTAIGAWYKPSAGSWTEIVSTTDSSISAGGPIGLQLSDTVTHLDNLSGGNYVSGGGGSVVPPRRTPTNWAAVQRSLR
jgi:hypothetical protein